MKSYFNRILVLPLGSFEYHGEELPPDTDAVIASAIADSIGKQLAATFEGDVLMLPPLKYGLSSEHSGLPNTAFVLHDTFYDFVGQLVTSVARPKDFVFIINAHGGNSNTLKALEADFNYSHADSKLFYPSLYPNSVQDLCMNLVGEFDAHAGSVEASMMAFYQKREAREYTVSLPKMLRGTLRFFRMSEVAADGVIKQTPIVIADPSKGEKIHEAIVHYHCESVMRLLAELSGIISKAQSK
jgi:creatinine amidohydrolase